MQIKRVGIVGAGTMGHGIAEISAMKGFEVSVVDISWDFLNRAKEKMVESLQKICSRGGLKETPEEIMSRVSFSTSYDIFKDKDFVIEAVPENLDLKRKVFSSILANTPSHAVLATNTSSIPISVIAEGIGKSDRVIGMHFFNPPVIMKLVEVIPSKYTRNDIVDSTVELAKTLDKVPVRLREEIPGFVGNRIYLRLMQEGCREVESNEATKEEVDSALRKKVGLPMGIFELADYVGLDVSVDLWNVIVSSGSAEDVPCLMYKEKIANKELGVKSGKGFYVYPYPGKYKKPELPQESKVDPARIMSLAVNEGSFLIEKGIVNAEDVDNVMVYGYNFPKGMMKIADEIGLDKIVKNLEEIYSKGYKAYKPVDLLKRMIEEGKTGKDSGKGFYNY
ncbi:3-hydroxyacyl-CoA dehydrogenase [Sulfuracidifex metallicus]|uniref:3-hydroxyacyl-CoA dehydrogenase n=1 Tax=Sulfuracidifex metallicus DSM 6482 = JCM 9184 TaxID=523847 RepID=A0A6A9QLA4_SULME|nr:3-hydroxyacyl-CoA dehydrogenase [Sulfuracidifex metallicus]MUN29374.1 3-hydroxyacyl-CoA dehydrogenase [Sulfuracidifex metallicus DSM 6482 = JCM 9184]WOE50114.1 3-hydroxyacyl-CoA dehydrogenase [Sulfuracidifex metallicus DSM 6482 = JCM 9184]